MNRGKDFEKQLERLMKRESLDFIRIGGTIGLPDYLVQGKGIPPTWVEAKATLKQCNYKLTKTQQKMFPKLLRFGYNIAIAHYIYEKDFLVIDFYGSCHGILNADGLAKYIKNTYYEETGVLYKRSKDLIIENYQGLFPMAEPRGGSDE